MIELFCNNIEEEIFMEKKRNGQLAVILVLAVAILFMSVGFAAYSTTLNINGTATVKANKWSVHFVDTSYAETTGSVAATNHTISDTSATYTVTLTKPGDFYEFSIDVINDGSFDAVLKSITMSTLSAAEAKYLTYTLTYDGTAYTASQSGLSLSLPYATGSNTKTVKVRVSYVQPENSADLPTTEDATVTLTASLGYEQAA